MDTLLWREGIDVHHANLTANPFAGAHAEAHPLNMYSMYCVLKTNFIEISVARYRDCLLEPTFHARTKDKTHV